ncbi:MAG: leucyl aminopeptidase family protein [Pseudomonadota bacterium]
MTDTPSAASSAIPLPDEDALASLLVEPGSRDDIAPHIPLYVISSLEEASALLEPDACEALGNWSKAQAFEAKPGQTLVLPNGQGAIVAAFVGASKTDEGLADPGFDFGRLASALPAGTYALKSSLASADVALTAFLLGAYTFTRFKAPKREPVRLITDLPERDQALIEARGVMFARDLINTPTNILGPDALGASATGLAEAFSAQSSVIVGDHLLDSDNPFPMIHTVGRASDQAPRLFDMRWNGADVDAPSLTLVGKGVCFDSGGLNIKPGNSMALMKKDMGGSACVLGLALMIMQAKLPVRLRVLVPIVENSISAGAFRPGDVLESRKGLTVEIGNTDAEGRLILADALALADEESPDLLIDMATLTGAARVALGPDLPPFFTDDGDLAAEIERTGEAVDDPVWRMPLWPRYEKAISGKVGDVSNTGSMPFAGAITAALFLKRFVEKTRSWVHFDVYGWTPSSRPGRPEGGEAQAIRLLFNLVRKRCLSPD